MFVAYRWARKQYQQRQQTRHDKPLEPPTTNTTELPRLSHPEAAPRGPAIRDTSPSLDSSSIAVTSGNPAVTKSAKVENQSQSQSEKPEPSPEEKAEQRRRRAYRWRIVIGLIAPFTLQSLDTTIIASALPFIASDFSKNIHQSGPFCRINPDPI